MKRLKYQCPFGGRQYPYYLVLLSAVIVPLAALIKFDADGVTVFGLMALCPAVIAAICYTREQRLMPDEQDLIDSSEYPLWQPVPPDLLDSVHRQTRRLSRESKSGIVLFTGFAAGTLIPRSGDPNYPLAGAFIIGALVCLIIGLLQRALWSDCDETAVFTVIPIDHMYDIKHHSRRGSWIESYLVFYLPDGRYTLRAKNGTGDAGAIAVVKFRGMVTWFPYRQSPPSDF